jgi:uncharacterized protein
VISVRGSQSTSTSSPESDLFAALDTGDRLAVAMALGSGVPIDAGGPRGVTACFLAASWGRSEILPRLIEGGADLELPDECGNTPLMAAVMGGDKNAEVMGMLLRAGDGGQLLSAPVRAHIRCYLVAGGSPVES